MLPNLPLLSYCRQDTWFDFLNQKGVVLVGLFRHKVSVGSRSLPNNSNQYSSYGSGHSLYARFQVIQAHPDDLSIRSSRGRSPCATMTNLPGDKKFHHRRKEMRKVSLPVFFDTRPKRLIVHANVITILAAPTAKFRRAILSVITKSLRVLDRLKWRRHICGVGIFFLGSWVALLSRTLVGWNRVDWN
jgi:hypothetical protein